MLSLDFARFFLVFLIYSAIGYVSEVIYCSIPAKRLVNRGFLYGPICPVYGFGGVLVMTVLDPFAETWIPLFLLAMVLTSAVEYLTSWILEKLFNTKWWDYSHYRLNIKGRVCLLNSLLFGIMGMVAAHFVNPFILRFVKSFSDQIVRYAAMILGFVLAADVLVTVHKLVNFNTYLAKMQEFTETLKEHFEAEEWFVAEKFKNMEEMFEAVRQRSKDRQSHISQALLARIESYMERRNNIEHWLKRFPTMTSTKYASQIEHLKTRLESFKKLGH